MKKLLVGLLALSIGQAFAAQCDISRDNYGNYYVSQNGQRLSNSKGSVSAAYNELQDLENYGMCRDGRRSRNTRLAQCELTRDNYGNFYVARNGQRMTSSRGSINSAASDKNEMVRSNVCVDERADNACDISRDNYGNFYVSINGQRMSSSKGSVEGAVSERQELMNANVCYEAQASAPCEIERDNYGNFYVSINGSRMSSSKGSISGAGDDANKLAAAQMCYLNNHRSERNRRSERRPNRRTTTREQEKVEIVTRTTAPVSRPVVAEVRYDHNEFVACYERPKTRLVTYTNTRQEKRGRNKVIGGLIGVLGGQVIGAATGNDNVGDAISVVGAAVAVYGAVEVADASDIIYEDGGYDCRSHYQVDRRVYSHRVQRQSCVTKRYYSSRWGSEHEYFETTCSGRKYMSFERNSEIWYN